MKNQIAFWKPWWVVVNLDKTIPEQVQMAIDLGIDRVSIKGVDGTWLYGVERNFSPGNVYRPFNNEVMVEEIRRKGLTVDTWNFIYLDRAVGEATAMNDSVSLWQPEIIDFDMEAGAKANAAVTPTYLQNINKPILQDGTRSSIYLQSYRRPDFHRELAWKTLLTTKFDDGSFMIDGVNPQAYPIHSQNFPYDFQKMLGAYNVLSNQIGRELDNWRVTLPTFSEHGWTPTAQALDEGMAFLVDELGDKLKGFQFWAGDWLIRPEFTEHREVIRSFTQVQDPEPLPDPEPEPTPDPDPGDITDANIGAVLRFLAGR